MSTNETYQDPVFIEPEKQTASTYHQGKMTLLLVGNSITRHGVYPSLGWDSERGMAASCESKDYVHQLAAALADKATCFHANVNLLLKCNQPPANVLDLLGSHLPVPDVIVLQTGEHEGPEKSEAEIRWTYREKLLRPLLSISNHPLMMALGPWFPTDGTPYPEWVRAINRIYKEECSRLGVRFASIEAYATHPACRGFGLVPPVQWHPNDLGMKGYAAEILRMLREACSASSADLSSPLKAAAPSLQAANLSWPLDTIAWDGNRITLRPAEEILPKLHRMTEAGIRNVMVSGFTEVEPLAFPLLEGAQRIRRLLAAEGVTASQHHGLCPMVEPGAGASQEDVRGRLRHSIEVTAALGSPILVLHAGRPAGHFSSTDALLDTYRREATRTSEEELMALCAENLRSVMPLAHSLGVSIALENVDRFEPLSSYRLLPQLVNAVDDTCLGYCFDSGHAHACGTDPVQWIRTMGLKLMATHLHDNHGPAAGQLESPRDFIPSTGIDEHLPPGFGTLDWRAIIRALRGIPYLGVVTFESPPWNLPGSEGYLAAIRFWRQAETLA